MIAAVAVACFAAAHALTWLARLAAPRLGIVDRPDGARKLHERSTPLLGGVAVFLAFTLGFLALAFFSFGDPSITGKSARLWAMLASAAIICGGGVWDDVRSLAARHKFVIQVLASLPFVVACGGVDSIQILGLDIQLGSLGLLFSIFWLVACTNALNLIDGLDGLASTVSMIAAVALVFVATGPRHAFSVEGASLLLAASVAGFLVHNWPPAKIFLGDAGSQTLGFLLGAFSLQVGTKSAFGFSLLAPAAVLAVPILDTALAILRRKLTGRSVGEPDRGHIHHQFQARGFSRLQTLLTIAGICVVTSTAGIIAALTQSDAVGLAICGLALTVIAAARILGHHEARLVFWHIRATRELLRNASQIVGATDVSNHLTRSVADPVSLERSWREVRAELERLGASEVAIHVREPAPVGPAVFTPEPWREIYGWTGTSQSSAIPDPPRREAPGPSEILTSNDAYRQTATCWSHETAVSLNGAEMLTRISGAGATFSAVRLDAMLNVLIHFCRTLSADGRLSEPLLPATEARPAAPGRPLAALGERKAA